MWDRALTVCTHSTNLWILSTVGVIPHYHAAKGDPMLISTVPHFFGLCGVEPLGCRLAMPARQRSAIGCTQTCHNRFHISGMVMRGVIAPNFTVNVLKQVHTSIRPACVLQCVPLDEEMS